jgi:glycosyltransferase involved in cell wall biosynthesis
MKVLLLATDAYGGHGGIAYYNRCLAESIASLPYVEEVTVVPRVMRFAAETLPEKVRFVAEAAGGKIPYLHTTLSLSREHFDLIICGHIHLLPLAAPLAVCKRTPLVLQVHGIEAWQPAPLVSRLCLKCTDAVWSVSAVTRERMNAWANLPLSKYRIIPNAVHLERYGLAPKRTDLTARYGLEGRKVIMTLARLAGFERYKGIDEILEVLPNLVEYEPTLVYIVLGDGDDQARLEAKAKSLGVADRVIFAGFIEEAEKADYLRLADVFALPGKGEGFGIVYLEALACGVPVLGSMLDGSREALLDGELGELVDPNEPLSIREGILRALAKPKEIPEKLGYFAWPGFKRRITEAVKNLAVAHQE